MLEHADPQLVRNEMISFCEDYLRNYPEPVLLHKQHLYVDALLYTLKNRPLPNRFELAMLLAETNELVIAWDKRKLMTLFGTNFPGTFRIALEDALRKLLEMASFMNSVQVDFEMVIMPGNITTSVVEAYFEEQSVELRTMRCE